MTPDPLARDALINLYEKRMASLGDQLASGSLSIGDWQIAMRTELRAANAMQVIAAAGGDKAAVDPNDWLKLGTRLKSQYMYLEDFAHQITDGTVGKDAISSRAMLYARDAKITYWQQATPDMPTYPGQTQCHGNCLCAWRDNGDGSYTWDRTNEGGTSCPDCIRNEQQYAHYVPEAA